MLDRYIFGAVERISPEAPIPIVAVSRETSVPGGAANTAHNIATLGGKAFLVGSLADDFSGKELRESCIKCGIDISGIAVNPKQKTIQKTRVIGQSQQLLRIDHDDQISLENGLEAKLLESILKSSSTHGIILSDYAKGTVTESLARRIVEYAKSKKIPLLVDPKPQHKDWYRGAFALTPNKKEAEAMLGQRLQSQDDLRAGGLELQKQLQSHIILTLGEQGMMVFEENQSPFHIPAHAREVFDVSGAGDTVIAALALAVSAGASLREAVLFANAAAGVKVGKLGTAPVRMDEIKFEAI